MWWWVKQLGAWPSSPEAMAAAFDYDRAPFFQSFMEIRVDGQAESVRFLLHGVNGRLKWQDIHVEGDRIPHGKSPGDFVEFVFPLPKGPS